MKFRDYVIKDKLLNKGTKKIKESSEYEVNGEELSLTSIIKIITEKIESTECPVLKTKCMLDIVYLLMSHLEKSFDSEGDDEDDEILIEKK